MIEEPILQGVPVGSPEFFRIQQKLIKDRPLVRHCYDSWYKRLTEDAASVPGRDVLLELGSGASYIKDYFPEAITTDIVPGVADRVMDAQNLEFPDRSVRAIFMTHCFHHIRDIRQFLREADRVLVPGGVIGLIEVAHTPFARFFFDRFHPEPYDDTAKEWTVIDVGDDMWSANQALSWIVFFRDRNLLAREFPNLIVEEWGFLPWITYLASGGVTRKSLLPLWLQRALISVEWLFAPLAPLMALHWHIRVRKVTLQ